MAGATAVVVVVVACADEGAVIGVGAATGCVDSGADDVVVGEVDAVAAAVTGRDADVVGVERRVV